MRPIRERRRKHTRRRDAFGCGFKFLFIDTLLAFALGLFALPSSLLFVKAFTIPHEQVGQQQHSFPLRTNLPQSSASVLLRPCSRRATVDKSILRLAYNGNDNNNGSRDNKDDDATVLSRRKRIRKRVSELAKNIVMSPIKTASAITPVPQAVASVLRDATLNAVDMAVDEVVSYRDKDEGKESPTGSLSSVDVTGLIDEAFQPLEQCLQEVQDQLDAAKVSLQESKQQSLAAMEAVEAAAVAQAEGAVQAVKAAEKEASRKVLADIYVAAQSGMYSESQLAELTFEDVDYGTSEMAPPFLGDDQCLVPGEPVVRVEKAPENSRRIFAGIDIPHSVDDVWKLLTDYNHLQDVIPNLVVNDVLDEYDNTFSCESEIVIDADLSEEVQCEELSQQMKGAKLRQVGGAKVAGIQFSARTTLEVREWPKGLPDFAHFNDEVWLGKSRKQRAKEYTKIPLQRYCFPRPFAASKLPSRDITMQSIQGDDGEFRMYQGVWRMQPLPGCSPPGEDAMRLTYAVEVSPRAYLPVSLVEGRIVRDLCTNLMAIRETLAKKKGL